MTYVPVDIFDLALAATLVAVNGVLSLVLQLGIFRQLVVATVRMIVQLTLVGLVLTSVFEWVSPWWTALVALAMVAFAGYEIRARQERKMAGWWSYGLGASSILFAAMLVTVFALTTQLEADPWYHPRFALPILGMILGNTMTGISLGLQTLTTGLVRERTAVEAQLCLGATRHEAMLPVTRDALRSGMMPTINAMAATGLVYLPGMMTGQILAGIEPTQAVQYQLLIMFLIAGGTALGTVGAVLAAGARLSDGRHRLRLDRLSVKNSV